MITLADSLYPNAATSADKIGFMNLAQNSLSKYFGTIVEDDSLKTEADEDMYSYPTGIKDISQIISLAVAISATPENRYQYTRYKLNNRADNPRSITGYYQIIDSAGAKKLAIYPIPTEDDLPVVIRYRKELTVLTTTAQTPDFDSKYHSLLVFYCCHMICTVGSSPDSYQADMFMAKYDTLLGDLWKETMINEKKNNKTRRDNKQWHRSNSYGIGF
jgi:hypothetical protein